jgi:hypothetical protein
MNDSDRRWSLDLEVEEIEAREKVGGNCTSSTTSNRCTCLCRPYPTTSPICGSDAVEE